MAWCPMITWATADLVLEYVDAFVDKNELINWRWK